jgi:RNA 2',3'-cyclic 3'-phosphodiesterase
MRIFIALDIDEAIRNRIARFMDGVRGFAPDARWVRPESLHITLKFIGERAPENVDRIKDALKAVQTGAIEMNIRGSGSFPGAKAPRVFWVGIETGPPLAALASTVDDAMAALGIAKEEHAFNPHLTLARGGGRSRSPRSGSDDSKRSFQRLQEKLAALPVPEFGTMTAREFFLYQSHLSRGGSRYEKLAGFTLG